MVKYEVNKELYPIIVEFEKKLAKGVLNGLTITDSVHFTSKKEAKSWIDAVSKLTKDDEFSNFKMRVAL